MQEPPPTGDGNRRWGWVNEIGTSDWFFNLAARSWYYFSSTLAPASSSCFLILAASSLLTSAFTSFGAPSTRSLASLRPRPVIARTSLITLIFLSPASVKTTVNSVFSAAEAAAGAAADGRQPGAVHHRAQDQQRPSERP